MRIDTIQTDINSRENDLLHMWEKGEKEQKKDK